ncbi:MAG: hypothetical protein LBE91_03435 [Tannerella sp.]|jgi:hypothetical protein|nr:hypothetical protein [Tannerella sp.]
MKRFFKAALIACTIGSLFIGCSKDDDTPQTPPVVYAEENPLAAYLAATGFGNLPPAINVNLRERGLTFIPKVNGKINAVTIKIPDNATNMRVTIWNVENKTVLRTIIIPSVSKDVEIKQNLDAPLPLTINKRYMISYNSDDYYSRNGAIAPYPIIAGNIIIEKYSISDLDITTQTFPDNEFKTGYAGDCSFVFQRTE